MTISAKPGPGSWGRLQAHESLATPHIDLGVVERHEGWSVFLGGSSTARMAETIRIAVALTEANLPVEIHHPEELTLRLLGKDNVGIITWKPLAN